MNLAENLLFGIPSTLALFKLSVLIIAVVSFIGGAFGQRGSLISDRPLAPFVPVRARDKRA